MRAAKFGNSAFGAFFLFGLAVIGACAVSAPAHALVVQNMAGTTEAPADDPGWDYVTQNGRNYVYLGDGWALSVYHVGLPDLESDPSDNANGQEDADNLDELLSFPGGSFPRIKGQAYPVKIKPADFQSGYTQQSDLRLIRIRGDLGTPTFKIGTQITENDPNTNTLGEREVVIVGPGPSRQDYQAQWNSSWTEVTPSAGTYVGFRSVTDENDPNHDLKRWGKNQIADEDCVLNTSVACEAVGNGDNDLRIQFDRTIGGGVGLTKNFSMLTRFDAPGAGIPDQETQVVPGDSGSAVFFKRGGQWELVGVVNYSYSTYSGQNSTYAVYPNGSSLNAGNYSSFADLSYYNQDYDGSILDIMRDHPYDQLMGDINLDGVVAGNGTGPIASDDISAFVAGWLHENDPGVGGTYGSWLKGDLSGDGKTDVTDFFLLRSALNSSGAGAGLSLASLDISGVPEPASVLLVLTAAAAFACRRGVRSRSRVA